MTYEPATPKAILTSHNYAFCMQQQVSEMPDPISTSLIILGSCLCGKITFEVIGKPINNCLCFCNSCRKFTGSIGVASSWYKKEVCRLTMMKTSLIANDVILHRISSSWQVLKPSAPMRTTPQTQVVWSSAASAPSVALRWFQRTRSCFLVPGLYLRGPWRSIQRGKRGFLTLSTFVNAKRHGSRRQMIL